MVLRCLETAHADLGKHFNALAAIAQSAIEEFYGDFAEQAHKLEIWTKRSIIRDLIKERMIAYCEETPGAQVIRNRNATYFGLESRWLLKIKKLNDARQACVGNTQASLSFDSNQEQQSELFDDADVTAVYYGYTPTENNPMEPPVYLVANNEQRKTAWVIELKGATPPSGPILEFDITSNEAPQKPRVRVRTKAGKEQSNG